LGEPRDPRLWIRCEQTEGANPWENEENLPPTPVRSRKRYTRVVESRDEGGALTFRRPRSRG